MPTISYSDFFKSLLEEEEGEEDPQSASEGPLLLRNIFNGTGGVGEHLDYGGGGGGVSSSAAGEHDGRLGGGDWSYEDYDHQVRKISQKKENFIALNRGRFLKIIFFSNQDLTDSFLPPLLPPPPGEDAADSPDYLDYDWRDMLGRDGVDGGGHDVGGGLDLDLGSFGGLGGLGGGKGGGRGFNSTVSDKGIRSKKNSENKNCIISRTSGTSARCWWTSRSRWTTWSTRWGTTCSGRW